MESEGTEPPEKQPYYMAPLGASVPVESGVKEGQKFKDAGERLQQEAPRLTQRTLWEGGKGQARHGSQSRKGTKKHLPHGLVP